jgi:hypothetical protein
MFRTEVYFDQRIGLQQFENTDHLVNHLGKIEKVETQLYFISVNSILHSFSILLMNVRLNVFIAFFYFK